MMTDGNQICDEHSMMYKAVESLYSILETKVTLTVSSTSIKVK